MRNILKLVVLTFILSSCAVKNIHNYRDNVKSRSYIELELSDIQLLGETNVSYKYSRYLFIGTRVISINGEQPDNGNKHYLYSTTQRMPLLSLFYFNNMNRALYKAKIEFPNADYFEISSVNIQTQKMFLGRKIKKTANVKAYKYKYATK
jgi:hypothetical protein